MLHISTTKGQYQAGIFILMKAIYVLQLYLFQLYHVTTVNM